ncbi:MAG: hypothetical protein R3E87_03280 [Burkholderiaceae bacterium]
MTKSALAPIGGSLVAAGLLFLSFRRYDIVLLLAALFVAAVVLAAVSRRLRSAAIVLASVLFALCVAELVIPRLPGNGDGSHRDMTTGYTAGGYFDKTDPVVGVKARPGSFDSALISDHGEEIYRVVYEIGADGYRRTPGDDHPTINVFGGSFVFGEGLNGEQTLPYALAQATGRGVKNYGMHGWGLHQPLALMESGELAKADINVILTAPWHGGRSACKPVFSIGTPRYVVRDGHATRDGKCTGLTGYSVLDRVLDRSSVARLIRQAVFGGDAITRDDVALYLALIARIGEVSRERGQRLIVGFIRATEKDLSGSGYTNDEILAAIGRHADAAIDLTLAAKRELLESGYYIHRLDQHPSGLANRVRAEKLRPIIDTLQ